MYTYAYIIILKLKASITQIRQVHIIHQHKEPTAAWQEASCDMGHEQ